MESNEISSWVDADEDTDIAGIAAATGRWPEMKKGNASITNTERRERKDMQKKERRKDMSNVHKTRNIC